MKAEEVVSLELAKQMKKLGWDYETEKQWSLFLNVPSEGWHLVGSWNKNPDFEYLPAPDAIEIWGELPYHSEGYKLWRCCSQKMIYSYHANHTEQHRNLSEALGQMWCYLKEKGLI